MNGQGGLRITAVLGSLLCASMTLAVQPDDAGQPTEHLVLAPLAQDRRAES